MTQSHRPLALLLAPALLLGACTATKESRVRAALTDAGVPSGTAACMAEPMARDLSVEQLRRLEDLSKLGRTPVGQLSASEALDRLRRSLDPESVTVVVRAGLGCALRG